MFETCIPLIDETLDERLVHALQVAEEWEHENVAVSKAMKASVDAHAVARKSVNPVLVAIARSIGHTVATAHMADHSLGAALYALKAVNIAGKSVAEEREWQIRQLQQLPPEIVELVLNNLLIKEKSFKLQ